jgi:biopolymer transport protein ExbB/TolQ
MLEAGFTHIVQALLWPVLALVALGFLWALWMGGAALVEAWQRWRDPRHTALGPTEGASMDDLEMRVLRQIEPVRLLSRLAPMLGLIATMVPLGPALQSVAAGEGQKALSVFSGAFAGVVLALASASIGLVVYSVRRRWLLAELLAVRKARGVAL